MNRRRKPQVCNVSGCWEFRPCPRTDEDGTPHERPAWEGSNRKGSTRKGQRVRARILERDPICVLCGQRPSTICDHVIQVAHGAPERYEDVPEELLRGICDDCNRTKSAKEGAAGRR